MSRGHRLGWEHALTESAGRAEKLVVISPVRNEAPHVDRVVTSVFGQHRRPDRWVVVDDGSDDDTADRLRRALARVDFAVLVSTPPGYTADTADRNAAGGPDRAWNFGLQHLDLVDWTHIVKLDGDIVLPPDYFDVMLRRFGESPKLGIAGGVVTELRGDAWWVMPTPADHPTAPARVYSRACFDAIGGMPPQMGADVITTMYAKMHGFETRTFSDLPLRHLRPMATADGVRRGRERQGAYQYAVHYPFVWIAARSVLVAVRFRPYGLSGVWFLWGYVRAALHRTARVEDPEWRRYARAEYRSRLWASARRRLRRVRRGAS